jgi:hypothetical protein
MIYSTRTFVHDSRKEISFCNGFMALMSLYTPYSFEISTSGCALVDSVSCITRESFTSKKSSDTGGLLNSIQNLCVYGFMVPEQVTQF